MNPLNCPICEGQIDTDNHASYITLTEKGALGVCTASIARNSDLRVEAGTKVHRKCREIYINKKNIDSCNKKASSSSNITDEKPNLRSSGEFCYKSNCLFCGNQVTDREKRGKKAYQVMCKYKEFVQSILQACEKRKDSWAVTVSGRISFVNDLHSEDAVYHQVCSSNFRTGKRIPAMYAKQGQPATNLKRGRHSEIDRESAFAYVANYLKTNDDEQITINDLTTIMKEQLAGSSSEQFTPKWMKKRLSDYFKDDIVFTEINGKKNVVTFISKAKNILHNFYMTQKSDDIEVEKNRIIETAAKLIKSEIKESITSSETYPSPKEIESLSKCKEYLPDSLSLLLSEMFLFKGNYLKIASIGQAITQAVRP